MICGNDNRSIYTGFRVDEVIAGLALKTNPSISKTLTSCE